VKFPVNRAGNFTIHHPPDIIFQPEPGSSSISFRSRISRRKGWPKIAGKMSKNSFDVIIEFLAYLAGIIIFAIAVIITVTAVVRYLGLRSPLWVLQYTEYGLLWFTFLGAAWLLRAEGHIRIDTVISMLHAKRRHKVEIMNDILGFIVSAIIFWFGIVHTIDLYQRGIMEVKGTTVPKFAFFLIIPLGGLTLSIQFGRHFFKKIRSKPVHGAEEG